MAVTGPGPLSPCETKKEEEKKEEFKAEQADQKEKQAMVADFMDSANQRALEREKEIKEGNFSKLKPKSIEESKKGITQKAEQKAKEKKKESGIKDAQQVMEEAEDKNKEKKEKDKKEYGI